MTNLAPNKKRIQVNVDAKAATEAEAVFEALGISPTTVLNMLYKKVAAEGKIPFDLSLTEDQLANLRLNKAIESLNKQPKIIDNDADAERFLFSDD